MYYYFTPFNFPSWEMTSSITKYFSPGIPMSERDMKPSSSHRAMVWRLTPAIFASTLWPIISLPRMTGYLYLRVAWLNLMRSITASTLFMVGRTRSCTRITASVISYPASPGCPESSSHMAPKHLRCRIFISLVFFLGMVSRIW